MMHAGQQIDPDRGNAWRQQWVDQGYVHLRGALPKEDVARALEGIDQAVAHEERIHTEHVSYRNDRDHSVRIRNAAASALLLDLVDHRNVLPTLLELLGPDIHVLGSEAFVTRLGITGTLARTLITSNPVESMISIARTTNRNVTHWRDGQMVLRWTAAGLLNAQRSFRRVRGYKQMPQLVAALHRHAHPNTAQRPETVGAAA